MAGHSKWANIKHRKARADKKRGKEFTKLIREITVAARLGGPSPADNPRLRTAIDKALGTNMPKDTIARAAQRGAGGYSGTNFEELTYEGYGPGGIAIIVEVMTDNRNRTAAAVRHTFSKYNGNLGTEGSVTYLFNKQGQISLVAETDADADAVLEVALEAGAEDMIVHEDGMVELATLPTDLSAVGDALVQAGHEPMEMRVVMIADSVVMLGVNTAAKIIKLMDALEDLDDVQNVFTNGDFPEDAWQP